LLQLAAIVDELGYKVHVFDNNVFRFPIDAVRQTLKEEGSQDIIGFSGLTTQAKYIAPMVKVAREEHPAALIVAGGGFLSAQPFDIMRWMPEFDIGCIGEGYNTWRDILEHWETRNWRKIKGLIYREGIKLKLSPMRPLIPEEKLDEEVPWPAYEFSPIENYLRFSAIPYSPESMGMMALNIGETLRRLDVMTSLGCPWKCYFCAHPACLARVYGKPLQGQPFRRHSPGYVVSLIQDLRMRYGVNFISFIDENFTVNKKWFMDFLSKLEESGLASLIHWGVVGHSVTVDAEMLTAGKDKGLSYISYGGETASRRLLKEMGKGQTPEQMTAAIDATHAAQVNPIMSFMVGLPGETIDDVIDTCQFYIDNQIHGGTPFFCTPYPGTDLYDRFKDKIIEQHLTEKEQQFIEKPTIESYSAVLDEQKTNQLLKAEVTTKSTLRKNVPVLIEKLQDIALQRWVYSLDDATKLSCNMTDFTDVELAGIQYMISKWDIERLKKFKKQLEVKILAPFSAGEEVR
jgi:anaerobic magnesium-protoporphyrin IX monomethyl ester cyclase